MYSTYLRSLSSKQQGDKRINRESMANGSRRSKCKQNLKLLYSLSETYTPSYGGHVTVIPKEYIFQKVLDVFVSCKIEIAFNKSSQLVLLETYTSRSIIFNHYPNHAPYFWQWS